jgi:versiconal hemiacetal acetate esterase
VPMCAKEQVSPFPVGLYFHGGGFCCGDLDSEDTFCRELAERLPCVVVSVDYRLAPEHKAPAQVDDALEAWDWVSLTNLTAPVWQQNLLTLGGIQ